MVLSIRTVTNGPKIQHTPSSCHRSFVRLRASLVVVRFPLVGATLASPPATDASDDAAAVAYLRSHNLPLVIEAALADLVAAAPRDPLTFLERRFREAAAVEARSTDAVPAGGAAEGPVALPPPA